MNGHTAYLLLGTNVGDRQQHLQHGLEKIKTTAGDFQQVSSVYETEPWGVVNQDDYLNMVVEIKTFFSPEELFKQLKAIETAEGRTDATKYAPRTLDIDVLFYDDLVLESEYLIIPHPRLHLRRFVLKPLEEIAASLIHPLLGKSIRELLKECGDYKNVRRVF
ncbi:MAG: 2-amino-4-hydroxy-6-hydroxymethyldihydropteridine diphosphokinase [Chitinophagales bacterium]